MTLSESQAMDTFEFLGSEDNLLAHRFSRASMDYTEGMEGGKPLTGGGIPHLLGENPSRQGESPWDPNMDVCAGIPRRSSSAQPSSSSGSGRHVSNQPNSSTPTPTSGSQVEVGVVDTRSSQELSSDVGGGADSENGMSHGSCGSSAVDRALMQHLIHCESLLVVSGCYIVYACYMLHVICTCILLVYLYIHVHACYMYLQ